jgi:hypothetical protein
VNVIIKIDIEFSRHPLPNPAVPLVTGECHRHHRISSGCEVRTIVNEPIVLLPSARAEIETMRLKINKRF